MKKDTFEYEITVTLKDINMYGTVYFSRYFEWQGICRELYFITLKNYEEVLNNITMVTKYAWNDYKRQIHAFEQILIRVQNRDIKKSSFEMMFTYINKRTNEIVSIGGETLIFIDNNGRIIKIPDRIVIELNKNIYVE
ncbi:MAG: thioesterase family protein [Candidatus Omnitrophica bacterium]|nr:thioesterase family protein [Candidatus Omnitrophota bacterium]